MWVILPGCFSNGEQLLSIIPKSDSTAIIHYSHSEYLSYISLCDELFHWLQSEASNFEIHLLGYSLGGRIAYSLMGRHRLRIKSVILISSGLPIVCAKSRYQKYKFERFVEIQLNQLSITEFIHWWFSLPIYSTFKHHSDYHNHVYQLEQSFQREHFFSVVTKLSALAMPFNRPDLSDETTYIYGQYDQKYKAIAYELKKRYPKIKRLEVPSTSHLCWLESPRSINI